MVITSKLPDINIPVIPLPDFITQNFHMAPPDRKVLIDSSTKNSYTCQQLVDTMNKVSAGFHKKGLKMGGVVALFLPNMAEYPIIMYGLQNIGGIPTTFNPLLTVEELQHQLQDSGASFLITIPSLVDKVKEVLKLLGKQMEVIVMGSAAGATSFSSLINNDGKFPKAKNDPLTTTAVIPYSSGTTGKSKGVELTHYNLVANVLQSMHSQVGVFGEYEVSVGFLPFFHIYGMVLLLGVALRRCCTLIVMPKFELQTYLEIIQEHKATILYVVPPVVLLLSKEAIVEKYDLKSVRIMVSGAAPLGGDLELALKARLPNVRVIQAYGMTELSPLTHSSNVFIHAPGSVGQLAPNLRAKIVDTETGKELEVGQHGELVVAGPNVMKGYLNNPSATAGIIDKDGFLHTGDIGYVDEHGNLFIVDRLKELIKYKGFQVAPADLEALLVTHPDIADVAVIGKPDLEAGELPLAFVVLKKGSKITEKEIIAWAEKKTSPHKKLRGGVIFVDAIPKSAAGKILRRLLRAKL